MVECVPNLSEGRDLKRVDAVERAIVSVPGVVLLHRTSDADHNRSVLTFAGSGAAVVEAAVRAVAEAAQQIDLNQHRGIHPRLGALDVLPFVPLGGMAVADCVPLAHEAGRRIWNEVRIPVYFYGEAAIRPDRRNLEDVRRGQFEGLRETVAADEMKRPDIGGPQLHSTAGAVIVGARKVLIAYNINLRTQNVAIAKDIAKTIRASSGGLPGIKALGLPLASRGLVQVSTNITDYELTSVFTVYSAVERLAAAHGIEIEESELIGLIPRKALEATAAEFLKLSGFRPQRVIENAMEEHVPSP
jgi:glutamate formiminotransferase